jgi:hypothetical protein
MGGLPFLGAAHPQIVGRRFHQTIQDLIAWQAKDVINVVGFAPGHDLGATVMTVPPNGQSRMRPMHPDTADEAAQVVADFQTRWRFPGSEQYGHGTRHRGVVNMDRQKAPFVIVRIEERELLMAMDNIDRVIDIECHRARRSGIAGAVEVNHSVGQLDDLAQGGRVLQS